uniref:Putative 5.3 kDa antibacterial peptide n=1 Tax=Rhipicephalus pulchellus TaxID=72859 RepID=L7MAM4_RHIPC
MRQLICLIIIFLCGCHLFSSVQAGSCSSAAPKQKPNGPTCVGERCGPEGCPSPCNRCVSTHPWCKGYCYLPENW